MKYETVTVVSYYAFGKQHKCIAKDQDTDQILYMLTQLCESVAGVQAYRRKVNPKNFKTIDQVLKEEHKRLDRAVKVVEDYFNGVSI